MIAPTMLYVVMVNDRHCDPEAYLFTDEARALAEARKAAQDWLVEQPTPADWLFYAEHPSESDTIWVCRAQVDAGIGSQW